MSPYDILGIRPGSSPEEIKKAYWQRMMQCHPDRGGNEEEAKKVNRAYEMITKPQPMIDPVIYQQPFVRVVFYGGFGGYYATTSTAGTASFYSW